MTRGVRGAAKPRAQSNVSAHGQGGWWQLETWCGSCGWGEASGAPVAVRGYVDALGRRCTRPRAFEGGVPFGACGWLMSNVWLYVPRD